MAVGRRHNLGGINGAEQRQQTKAAIDSGREVADLSGMPATGGQDWRDTSQNGLYKYIHHTIEGTMSYETCT